MFGESPIKTLARFIWAAFMLFAGVKHFTNPELFMSIMPTFIPFEFHKLCVDISGVAEILGAIGIVFPNRGIRNLAATGK